MDIQFPSPQNSGFGLACSAPTRPATIFPRQNSFRCSGFSMIGAIRVRAIISRTWRRSFRIQGLELDWICVAWDADLRYDGKCWLYHSFRGVTWTTIHKDDRKRYLLNAYRVLLTRARQGMVIFVPSGDEADPTRAPALYDQTHAYLSGIGIPQI